MLLGFNIELLRKGANLSQEELAKSLNISTETIHQWECDQAEPSLTNITNLCNFFGVSTDELIGRAPLRGIDSRKPGYVPVRDIKKALTPRKAKRLKITSDILFILTLLSPWIALALSETKLGSSTVIPWGFIAASILPITSLILGVYGNGKGLRVKKNIIAGAILCILLLSWGSLFYFQESI